MTHSFSVLMCDSPHPQLLLTDRQLFGFCPAKDNFFVVVCEICKLPFKPQTFLYHFGKICSYKQMDKHHT